MSRSLPVDGSPTTDAHTHELRVDGAGNLFGEDLEHLGGERWRHRVWKLAPDGRLSDLFPWRDGFRDDYGFVADTSGGLYWASCIARHSPCVVKRLRNGEVTIAARGARFARPLNFLADDGRGGVLLADGNDVLRITPADELEAVATELSRANGRFALWGLQATVDGSSYVAAFEDRAILRVDQDGGRSVVARSESPWKPTAVLVAPGVLWVLEFDGARAQVLRLARPGGVRVYEPVP